MVLSEESRRFFSERRKQFDLLKRNTPVGIFGSFYETRKSDLNSLKKFLLDMGYYARISEDLDRRNSTDQHNKDPVLDRELSERLILESDIHIFILVKSRKEEPDNLIQSVSMELERLHTMDECGRKSAKYVVVYAERGLIETMGGVCKGLLLLKRGDWDIQEFDNIREIFKPARQFCLNCLQDMYSY